MEEVLEGLPPKHFHTKDGKMVEGKQFISVNTGAEDNPVYEYKEVLRRWIGNNNRWYMAYSDDGLPKADVTLDNARYFNGAAYRGDVAIFGNGLKELPDPVESYRGSLYKFYSNLADVKESYVNFALEGTGVPFTLDGIHKICRLSHKESQYIRTVTKAGFEGYNWGCGAFVGTVFSKVYPNTWSLLFRVGDFVEGQDYQWLLYGGSKPTTVDSITGATIDHTSSFGAYISKTGEITYFRNFDKDYVETKIQLEDISGWHQIQLEQTAGHACTLTVDKGTPQEKTGSCTLKMISKEFDDVLFNCGPKVNYGAAPSDVYDRSVIGNLDVRRFYINTTPAFDESKTPKYYEQPKMLIQYRKGDSDLFFDVSEYLVNFPHEQESRKITYTLPDVEPGQYYLRYESNYGISNELPVYIEEMRSRDTELYSDFSDLIEMRGNWLVAHKQWGGTGVVGGSTAPLNGGVVRENVKVYPYYKNPDESVNGVLRLEGHGTFYDGPVLGVDKVGNPSPEGRKTEVGAAIVTKDYLGAGSYKCKMRAPYRKGACTAMWTFHYEEIYDNDKRWDEFVSEGLHPQGTVEDGQYLVRNHEIDIEFPTALKDNPDMEDVSAENARLNTWIGELRSWDLDESDPNYFSEYTDFFEQWVSDALSDGKWHEIRFDWHTADPNPPAGRAAKRVDFYVDGEYKWTNDTHIPDIPGRLWLGLWYPRAPGNRWAGGYADYITDSIDIDYFHYTPFKEPMRLIGETYPDDVWRDWVWDNFDTSHTDTLPEAYSVPKPFDGDVIPKLSDGSWNPDNYKLAGANPPAYISPYRLEFRNDRKNYKPGAGECIISGLTPKKYYKITANVVSTKTTGGVQLVTFVSGDDVHDVDVTSGATTEVSFEAQTAGKVVIRRDKNKNRYEGLIDIKIEETSPPVPPKDYTFSTLCLHETKPVPRNASCSGNQPVGEVNIVTDYASFDPEEWYDGSDICQLSFTKSTGTFYFGSASDSKWGGKDSVKITFALSWSEKKASMVLSWNNTHYEGDGTEVINLLTSNACSSFTATVISEF